MSITEETRRESYHAVIPTVKQRKNLILSILRECGPMTAQEMACELHKRGYTPSNERNFAAPRMTELKNAGAIETVGKKMCFISGRSVAIWAVRHLPDYHGHKTKLPGDIKMNHTDILELARKTAERLGIRIKDPALVPSSMKPVIGTTTILYNRDFILWIDKHYIAYSDNFKPEIVYIFTDTEHVGEELRSVIGRIRSEKSTYALQTLMSVKRQLQLAGAAMRQSDSRLYFFGEIPHTEMEEEDVNGQPYIITLCPKCRAAFDNTGAYIRRADPNQQYKEKCTYCNVRDGYDYKVTPKGRREKR